MGNITKITASSGDQASYTYDSLNQLTSEIITENGITRTISYTYDSHGNMTSRIQGNKETVYTYDLDRLVQIEEKEDGVTTSTQTLTYDDAGNLITDGEFTYTWQKGRQLQGIVGTDLTTSYKYNENGLRTQKTVNGQTHEYTLLGSSVTREVIRDNAGNIVWTIHYSYAGDSTPVSLNVNGTEYYYLKNAQGDITHIVDGDGNEVASYEYDAWGNHLSITGGDIAQLNPYRYRGYRYDSETGLYYLQSRYYNPEWGRFINADDLAILTSQGELIGQNLYAYCTNNPVNFLDDCGYWKIPTWAKVTLSAVAVVGAVALTVATFGAATPLTVVATSAAIGCVVGGTTNVVKQRVVDKKDWKDINIGEVAISAAAGGVSGALATTPIGAVGQSIGNSIISGTATAAKGGKTTEIIENAAYGGIAGLLGGDGAYISLSNSGINGLFFSTSGRNHELIKLAASGIMKSYVASGGIDAIKFYATIQ